MFFQSYVEVYSLYIHQTYNDVNKTIKENGQMKQNLNTSSI